MRTASPDSRDPAAPRRARGRPRKTADERDDGNRRQALLAAAARLFRQQGFAATSTRGIAAAAGMRAGSPFYHFESKQALLAGVVLEGMERALQRQGAALRLLPADAGLCERLRALVRSHVEVLLGPDSDFVPVMLYEWRSLDGAQRGEIKRLKDRYEADWVPVLEDLHRSGRLGGDPVLARLMIFGALNWSVRWYAAPGPLPAAGAGHASTKPPASLDELTTSALQLFLKNPV